MQALIYYLSLPIIHVVARLPFSVVYMLSDLLRFLVFGVFGYRKEVVRTNLAYSFPEKSESERNRIQRDFEQWFCDLTLETIKTLAIGPKEVRKRIAFEGKEVLEDFRARNQSIIVVLGHFGNWELAGARYSQETDIPQLYVIYHPLHNKYFDRLFYKMRTRHGTRLYPMKETSRRMLEDRELNTATAFIADQTPSPKRAYWTTFLNQDTPVFFGTEAISKKLNYPIVYISISRPKRGYYNMRAEVLVDDPQSTEYGEITEKHTQRLERDIRNSPDIWLWTHRRWKHKRPSESL